MESRGELRVKGRVSVYSASSLGSHHFRCQSPCSTAGGTHGAAVCPDVVVFIAIAGGAVPVAFGVICDIVGHDR